MLSRRTALIAAIVTAIVVAVVATAIFLNRAPVRTVPTPTPSVTSGLDPATAKQIEQYSREFVTTYLTYQRPNDPAYLASLKPFLSTELNAEIVAGAAAARAGAPPQQGTVESVSTSINGREVTASVTARVTEVGVDPYNQTFQLKWQRRGDRWNITELKLLNSTRKFPYLES